jgi:CubicO group peptidase (beta-lactamase class C family)
MAWWKKTALTLLAALMLAALAIQLAGHGYFWTALRYTYLQGHNTAHIDDARNFAQAPIAGGTLQPWERAGRPAAVSDGTLAFLREHRSAAFVVVHQGSLIHETYFEPYAASSRTNTFSVTKTLVTLATGAAVADGIVPSFDAPLGTYVPEYAQHPLGAKATLAQLSSMTSGHEWSEHYYLPLNPTTELYFGGDTTATVLRQGFERAPDTDFEYSSASTQLLGLALSRSLAKHDPKLTLADYLSAKLWQPLGLAESSWSLDRPREQGGIEMAYCCVHTNARDLARIGQMLLQGGQWKGQQVLPAAFVARITQPNRFVRFYGHSLWMDPDYKTPFYYMQGHLGQYVIVIPQHQLVVVRLGQYRKKANTRHPQVLDEVYRYVDEAVAMIAR